MIVHDKFDFMLQVDAVVKKINTAVFADKYKTPFAEYNAFPNPPAEIIAKDRVKLDNGKDFDC